ncbi:MAG TPA: hypothetical protein DDW52_23120 [Planctomycetaceae bacterium]|nr:hypothetical protein [Planctomycetaceae bacterium]
MEPEPESNPDQWVDGEAPKSNLKPVRLTFDLDRILHGRLRRYCFDREEHVSDFVRGLIAEALPD